MTDGVTHFDSVEEFSLQNTHSHFKVGLLTFNKTPPQLQEVQTSGCCSHRVLIHGVVGVVSTVQCVGVDADWSPAILSAGL